MLSNFLSKLSLFGTLRFGPHNLCDLLFCIMPMDIYKVPVITFAPHMCEQYHSFICVCVCFPDRPAGDSFLLTSMPTLMGACRKTRWMQWQVCQHVLVLVLVYVCTCTCSGLKCVLAHSCMCARTPVQG